MKKLKKVFMIFLFCFCAVGFNSYALAATVVFKAGGYNDVKKTYRPDQAYRWILIQNQTPFWVLIQAGEDYILEPGASVSIERNQPLGWLSPIFGPFYVPAYAYRGYNPPTLKHRRGQLYNFVGRQSFAGILNGYTVVTNDGQEYGCIVVITYFPLGYNYPDQWIVVSPYY